MLAGSAFRTRVSRRIDTDAGCAHAIARTPLTPPLVSHRRVPHDDFDEAQAARPVRIAPQSRRARIKRTPSGRQLTRRFDAFLRSIVRRGLAMMSTHTLSVERTTTTKYYSLSTTDACVCLPVAQLSRTCTFAHFESNLRPGGQLAPHAPHSPFGCSCSQLHHPGRPLALCQPAPVDPVSRGTASNSLHSTLCRSTVADRARSSVCDRRYCVQEVRFDAF